MVRQVAEPFERSPAAVEHCNRAGFAEHALVGGGGGP
jgi:hypothetical protein